MMRLANVLAAAVILVAGERVGAETTLRPRHVVKIDVLAWAAGRELYGVSYERVPLVIGLGVGRDLEFDTQDVEAPTVALDVVGVGLLGRWYAGGGLWGRHGLYVTAGLAYTHGEGTGIDGSGQAREYRYDGYEVSLLGLGYQAIFVGHVALDVSVSFRQALGYLRSETGDDGTAGGYGITFAGGLGIAF